MAAHAFNPSTGDVEAGRSLTVSSRPANPTESVPRQTGLLRETLSRRTKNKVVDHHLPWIPQFGSNVHSNCVTVIQVATDRFCYPGLPYSLGARVCDLRYRCLQDSKITYYSNPNTLATLPDSEISQERDSVSSFRS